MQESVKALTEPKYNMFKQGINNLLPIPESYIPPMQQTFYPKVTPLGKKQLLDSLDSYR